MAPKAYLCIVLHAHLPYVRRPDLPAAFEEDWLFEGITETYLPLLDTLDRLALEKVPYRLVISLSPTLCEMLRDKLLISRYKGHLERSIALARKEVDRLADDPDAGPVARMYLAFFEKARELFTKRYLEDIPAAFMRLARMGGVELATTCATHAFLPLQMTNQPAAFAQIRLAAQHFKNLTGARPSGFWLPECGYDPSLERALLNEGVRWTIVDALGILAAKPSPPRGVLAPVRSPSGLTFFGRDLEASRQVWNARTGYPGHPDYRDFYRDQGHELEEGHLKDYLAPYGHRKMTGLKYHRITGGRGPKEIYDIEAGRARAVADAENFIESRLRQVEALGAGEQTPPVFTAPFDAELFGHWWWEGHIFLESLIRRIANIPGDIALVTPLDYLKLCPESHEARISPSSWGLGGHSEMWLDPSNDWIYPHLHKACREMEGLAALYPEADEVMKRALDQAAKELTLAQASDWPFMMKTGVMREYAEGRFKEHMVNFRRLKDGILSGNMDIPALEAMETRHPLFKGLDFSVFGG